jgi:hypothetical protein
MGTATVKNKIKITESTLAVKGRTYPLRDTHVVGVGSSMEHSRMFIELVLSILSSFSDDGPKDRATTHRLVRDAKTEIRSCVTGEKFKGNVLTDILLYAPEANKLLHHLTVATVDTHCINDGSYHAVFSCITSPYCIVSAACCHLASHTYCNASPSPIVLTPASTPYPHPKTNIHYTPNK